MKKEQKKNISDSQSKTTTGALESKSQNLDSEIQSISNNTELPSPYAPLSILKLKRNNSDKIQEQKLKTIADQMAIDLNANKSAKFKEIYVNELSKNYPKDKLFQIADSISPPTNDEIAKRSLEQSDELGQATEVKDAIKNYVLGQIEGIKTGSKQLAKGAAQATKLDATIGDIGEGYLNAIAGTGKTALATGGLVVPQIIGFNIGMETIKKIPNEYKAKIIDLTTGTSQGLSEDQKSETFDRIIDMPFAAVTTIAHALGRNPKEDSGEKAFYEILDFAVIAGAAKYSEAGGKTDIKNGEDLISTVKKIKDGEATDLELQDYANFTKALQGVTIENIAAEAEKNGNTGIVNKIDKANKVPYDELHTQLAELQSDQHKLVGEDKLLLQPKIEYTLNDILEKSDEEASSHSEGAKIEGIKSSVEELKNKKEGLNPVSQEAIQEQVDNLESQIPSADKAEAAIIPKIKTEITPDVTVTPPEDFFETYNKLTDTEKKEYDKLFMEDEKQSQKFLQEKKIQIDEQEKSIPKQEILDAVEQFNDFNKKQRKSETGNKLLSLIDRGAKEHGFEKTFTASGKVQLAEIKRKIIRNINKRTPEAIKRAKEMKEERRKVLTKTPSSIQEWVKQYVLNGGKVSAKDFERNTGHGPKDRMKNVFSDKGSSYHDLWESAKEEAQDFVVPEDNSLFDDMISEELSKHLSKESMYESLSKKDAYGIYNVNLIAEANAMGIDLDDIQEQDIEDAHDIVEPLTDEEAQKMYDEISDFDNWEKINTFEENYGLTDKTKVEGKASSAVSKEEKTSKADTKRSSQELKDKITAYGESLKDWAKKNNLSSDLPEGTVKSGYGFDDLVDLAVKIIHKGIDTHGDISKAIDEAIEKIKSHPAYSLLTKGKEKIFEDKLRKEFEPKKNIPPHSAKNEVITAKRKALGEEPVFKEMKQTDKALFDEVAGIISDEGKVPRLVENALTNNRFTFTQAEQLAVLREHSMMDEKLGELDKKVIKGDTSEKLRMERDSLRLQMRNYEQVLTNIGTVSGQVLRARQFFINKELTQTSILRNMEADSKSGELPQEQKDLVEKLFKERKEAEEQREALEKKLEEKESENAMLRKARELKETVAKDRSTTRAKRSNSIEETKRNIAGLKNQLALNQRARAGGPAAHGASMATLEALAEDAPIITQIALEHVKSGILKAADLRDAVYEDIKDFYEGVTKREVADIISGYGKQLKQNQDIDLKALRDLKAQLRLMSGIEDVKVKGQLPVKTGLIRDPQSPDARILRQELAKAIKEEGLDTDINADPKKWRSAIQRVETSLKNQIELLDQQIADQKRIGNTPTALIPTAEIISLRAERDAKRKALDTVLEQAGVITKETLNANKKALEKKIAEFSSAIKSGTEIAKKEQKEKVTNAENEQLKKDLDTLKKVYTEWYDSKNVDNKVIAKLSGSIKKVNERISEKETAIREGDLEKILPKVKSPEAELKSDEAKKLAEELREAKVKEGRVNLKIKTAREDWRLSQRGGIEKTVDFIDDLTREFAISALSALPKIFTSGVANQLLKPIENAIGAGTAKAFPQVAKVATIEGKYDLGVELASLGKYVDKKSWSEAWNKFKTGQHSEDILYGDEKHKEYKIPVGNGKYINPFVFGRAHAFLKTPTYKVAYERALQYLTADAIKDSKNFEGNTLKKSVIENIEKAAFEEGKRNVFLQPNAVAKSIRGFIYQKENSKVAAARIFAKVAKFQVQVLNVGLNFYSSQLSYVPGFAHVKALVPLLDLKMRRAMNELSPDQANYILRNMKTGNVGVALFALGYMLPNIFGGYNKNRDDDYDVKKGDIKVGGYALPHWATHIPIFYVMQLGATLKRSMSNDETVSELALQSAKSAVEQNPFAYNSRSISGAMENEKKGSQFLFDQTVGRFEPQLLNELAKQGDKDDEGESIKRQPQSWWDMAKMKIPGLRKTVEEK